MLELVKELKAAAIKLKVNKYDHIWLKNELTDDWSHGSPYEYFILLSNYHQVIELCEYIEHAYKVNEDSTKLIEAFCADDAEWHKLLDAREQENLTLISLVVKLADKCTEMQKELEHINNLKPIGYMESKGEKWIRIHGFTHINEEKSRANNIPVYRLNK
nr:hypothetical protein [Providencia sp. R33]